MMRPLSMDDLRSRLSPRANASCSISRAPTVEQTRRSQSTRVRNIVDERQGTRTHMKVWAVPVDVGVRGFPAVVTMPARADKKLKGLDFTPELLIGQF